MIMLGGVALSSSLQWVNRFDAITIAQTTRYTRGGNIRVYRQRLMSGIPIQLRADESTGWFTESMRSSVLALADALGEVYDFHFFSEDYQVIFDHGNPPAASFEKMIYRQVPDSTDYFMGQISLITV